MDKLQAEFTWVDYTKECTKCNKIKKIDDYNWVSKERRTRRAECKECNALKNQLWYANAENKARHILHAKHRKYRNREFIHNYKVNNPCINCGETDPLVLDFDHRDRTTKEFGICDSVHNGLSIKRIEEEIAKCDMLCANCHRRKTAKEDRYYSYKVLYEGYKYVPEGR